VIVRFGAIVLVAFLAAAQNSDTTYKPGRRYSTIERMNPEHLEAVHQARLRYARERKQLPPGEIWQDVRAVMHIHAEDAPHTKGTRPEVLAAAKLAQVKVVLWSDHRGPKSDTWSGMREGILFLPGAEEDHRLRFPSSALNDTLLFLSHLEERPQASSDGSAGMEIYNRHSDESDETQFESWFLATMKKPDEWVRLVERARKYPDEVFAAGCDYWPEFTARWDRETATHPFTGIAANDAHQNQVFQGFTLDPYEVSFRNVSTHILAREVVEADIRRSLREGRVYVAHDWLCDPSGFQFAAVNNLGVYTMGDKMPLLSNTRIIVRTPVPAKLKVFRNGTVVEERSTDSLALPVKESGAYRVEAWLSVDGEERPWIYSNPLYLVPPSPAMMMLPALPPSDAVEVAQDIPYVEGKPEDAAKHKLDLYLPKGKPNAPVFFFVHGGSWRFGDRSQYRVIGQRFARQGIAVAIPSYRLAPANPHPAQIEDVAAAFAWVRRNIAKHGGDPKRIFIGGHSAGGHLVALLALDGHYLQEHGLSAKDIRAVVAMSGVYAITGLENVFGKDPQAWREASPVTHVRPGVPPFTITYCQWDYATLPRMAVEFHRALRAAGNEARLVYVPGESHISEIISALKDGDATAEAILERVPK
jgi:acetyl esterase/lipase